MTVVHTYFYIEVPVIVQAVTLTLFYRALWLFLVVETTSNLLW